MDRFLNLFDPRRPDIVAFDAIAMPDGLEGNSSRCEAFCPSPIPRNALILIQMRRFILLFALWCLCLQAFAQYNTPFLRAVIARDTAVAHKALEGGANPNLWHPRDQRTVLMIALDNTDRPMAKLLIAHGAILSGQSGLGFPIEHCHDAKLKEWFNGYLEAADKMGIAARAGDFLPIEKLVKQGFPVDLRSQNAGAMRPLQLAAQLGHVALVEKLLTLGAKPNLALEQGWLASPLYRAAENGNVAIAQILIDHGADVNFDTNYTALSAAIEWKHPDIAKLLIEKGANLNTVRRDGHCPLTLAATHNLPEIVELLLANGATVPLNEKTVHRALHGRSVNGDTALFHILVERFNLYAPLPPPVPSIRKSEPLRAAIANGDLKQVQFIVEQQHFDINHYDGNEEILLWTIRHSNPEIAQYLIMQGAPIHGHSGPKAMVLATTLCNAGMVEVLLRNGVKAEYENYNYTNQPIYIASQNNCLETAKVLLKYGASIRNGLAYARKRTDTTTLAYIRSQQKPFNDAGIAIQINDQAALAEFLRNYQNPNANVNGKTLLSYAIEMENWEAMNMLLKAGANPNIPDFQGKYPMMLLAAREHSAELIRTLVEAGGDVCPIRVQGFSPLVNAVYAGDEGNVKALLAAGARDQDAFFEKGAIETAQMMNYQFLAQLILEHEQHFYDRENLD
jgi:ankyrin repeat protein